MQTAATRSKTKAQGSDKSLTARPLSFLGHCARQVSDPFSSHRGLLSRRLLATSTWIAGFRDTGRRHRDTTGSP
ncbi:hypothetical protein BKA00_005949 [Actinomadura coerulea]|uniref:Uncharacterized protein n=1 Tax=Actinomadura coerulea TaxID=46159 RepID=A0A7X0G400_9ACTN|nr:hypothetical protein [Actinomadura coerulea]GGQ22957.1 hypothetical protein GCM10010187_44120 [Actinomadura coerulea]